ncbi:MAG TPA: type II toxin-antitoxin system RelE/ParE family toxin [Gammaproteobacteria bacterium]|nr:type II toxin-antitoxin system RelE/ParE family toxin [Gammaproteobacteria bacterium]
MNVPGWKLRPLRGDRAGHWAVWVTGNGRLIFSFESEDSRTRRLSRLSLRD